MYYIGQEIIARYNTLKYNEGDKIIIHRIDRDWLYDENNKQIHQRNVAPSFTAGDTVWDTHSNTTFVIYQIVDDQVHSITPVGSTDPSFLRGRPISRVRSLPITATPATPHPDTERLDWLLSRLSMVTREDIDRLRGVTVKDDGWIPWSGGTCPVDGDTRVIYKVRSRILVKKPALAKHLCWTHEDCAGDIMAYQVVK